MSGEPTIRFFRTSPDEGDPECLCSVCLKPIPEFTSEGELYICLRMWNRRTRLEARFHDECIPASVMKMARAS